MAELTGIIRTGAEGEQCLGSIRGLLAIDNRKDAAALALLTHRQRPNEAALLVLSRTLNNQFVVQYALPVYPSLLLKASGNQVFI